MFIIFKVYHLYFQVVLLISKICVLNYYCNKGVRRNLKQRGSKNTKKMLNPTIRSFIYNVDKSQI